jgi:hypothetical protein
VDGQCSCPVVNGKRQHTSLMEWNRSGKGRTGRASELVESQAYPPKLGHAIVSSWMSARSGKSTRESWISALDEESEELEEFEHELDFEKTEEPEELEEFEHELDFEKTEEHELDFKKPDDDLDTENPEQESEVPELVDVSEVECENETDQPEELDNEHVESIDHVDTGFEPGCDSDDDCYVNPPLKRVRGAQDDLRLLFSPRKR